MEEDKIRCFVAIDLPREMIKEVERVQNEIKKKKIFTGKLTEGENLHLTLKFLGEIDLNKVEKIKEKLKEIKIKKFQAKTGSLGYFSPSFIKIIWIKCLGKGIFDLQKQIDEKLLDLYKKEERFMSHLTIARVKDVSDKKIFVEELKKVSVKELIFDVNSFFLIKSELKPEGPDYTLLGEFALE